MTVACPSVEVLEFLLLSSLSYRNSGLVWVSTYTSVTLLLSDSEAHLYLEIFGPTGCGSQCPSLLGLPLSVLHSVREQCGVSQGKLRLMWRNLFASFASPLMCSVQWNPLHKGFSGYRIATPSQFVHLSFSHPPFSCPMAVALSFQKNCQNHVPLWDFTYREPWGVKAHTSLSNRA